MMKEPSATAVASTSEHRAGVIATAVVTYAIKKSIACLPQCSHRISHIAPADAKTVHHLRITSVLIQLQDSADVAGAASSGGTIQGAIASLGNSNLRMRAILEATVQHVVGGPVCGNCEDCPGT